MNCWKIIRHTRYSKHSPQEFYLIQAIEFTVYVDLQFILTIVFIIYINLQKNSVGAIHLSHNQGKADTHDLIPQEIWFNDYLSEWNQNYYLTYPAFLTNLAIAFSESLV